MATAARKRILKKKNNPKGLSNKEREEIQRKGPNQIRNRKM
jgi:hypothetical protein